MTPKEILSRAIAFHNSRRIWRADEKRSEVVAQHHYVIIRGRREDQQTSYDYVTRDELADEFVFFTSPLDKP